jgi:hypothetical protein
LIKRTWRSKTKKTSTPTKISETTKKLRGPCRFFASAAELTRSYPVVSREIRASLVSSRSRKLRYVLHREPPRCHTDRLASSPTLTTLQIPQLQAHCKRLTEAGRAATCRRFLNAYSQFVNSLALWASNDGTGIILSDAQLAAEGGFLQAKLLQLRVGLEKSVQGCLGEIKESLAETIYDRFDQVIEAAVDEANTTAAKWGAPVNRENRAAGGYFWATYKYVLQQKSSWGMLI